MDAVASAVGSREVGSWTMPMIARGFDEPPPPAAAGAAGAAAAADGDGAAEGLATTTLGAVEGAAAGGLVGLVAAAAVLGGAVGAIAGVAHAASSAETIGRPIPSRRRSARRSSSTPLSYRPFNAASCHCAGGCA